MDPILRQALREADGILFLCSGNMLRSAFAELYARHIGLALPVLSAATTYDNPALHPEAARALVARGVERAHIDAFRPQHQSAVVDRVGAATVVLGMTHEHVASWRAEAPVETPLFLILLALGRSEEIVDPLFSGAYAPTFRTIERCVDALAESLQ